MTDNNAFEDHADESLIRARRVAAGLPVLICPKCKEQAAHWVSASLKAPGYFSCKPVRS